MAYSLQYDNEEAGVCCRETHTITITDDHMIAAMRLLLASLALLIVYIDPAEPVYHIQATYVVLAGYFVYSTLLYGLTWRQKPFAVVT